jgi:hypothetical protein
VRLESSWHLNDAMGEKANGRPRPRWIAGSIADVALPGRPRSSNDLLDAHTLNPATESRTVRRVSISQQKPRCGVPGKGIGNLLGKPNLRGIFGHAEMNDFPALWKHIHSADYAQHIIMLTR